MMRWSPVWLAVPATLTAASLSVMAGWQRGGWLPERALWIAIGVVLVVACHLLPALCRSASWAHRCIGGVLWAACTLATCYGHATFFLFAQEHAGERRADAVVVPASRLPTGRDLAAIAEDRAAAVSDLAARCPSGCSSRRVTLQARIDALDAEATETRRREAQADRLQAQQDRTESRRDDLRADPVTGRLAGWLGVQQSRIDLLTGLLMAAVLEGVACFCWLLAPHPTPARNALLGGITGLSRDASNDAGNTRSSEPVAPVTPDDAPGNVGADPDMERITQAIEAGELRATVAGIRQFLCCSQTRAVELRRALTT